MTYRTRTFLGAFLASVLALGAAIGLVSVSTRRAVTDDIRAGLVRQARLAALLIAATPAPADLAAEVDRVAELTGSRVTVLTSDGVVLADSALAAGEVAALDNHGDRPEVVEARGAGGGVGVASRHSATTGLDTMYAAVQLDAPRPAGGPAIVRLALPLAQVGERLQVIRQLALAGLGVGLITAFGVAWVASRAASRRIAAIASAADRYRRGDFSLPAHDYGGDDVGLVAKTLDQTARDLGARLAEMARDRAHTHAILSGMVEGVVLVDGSGRLVLTNPAVRSMLRLPEGPEDRHYLEVVREPAIATQVAAALEGRRTAPVEVQLDPHGRRSFMSNVVPVPAERGGGAVLVLHDVTEIRRADQMRRDFVANVSHELRTPLTAIRGYVEALTDDPPPDQARAFLDVIARHALRMEHLVRDLLRLARLDAGQEPLAREAAALAPIVALVEHGMETALRARQQRIALSVATGADTVWADPAKLHDVLRNLIENAINYSPEGGLIDVAARPTDGGVEITVADRGPGIPADAVSRIFERFYRVDRSRARDPGGTGLGLSIVRHLVELHEGRAWAEQREGGGAAVGIWLPDAAQSIGSSRTRK